MRQEVTTTDQRSSKDDRDGRSFQIEAPAVSLPKGGGNGLFGLGWNLTVPNITRKTGKGLPRYWDAAESDIFILTGAEDLVPQNRQIQSDARFKPQPWQLWGRQLMKLQ